MDLGLEKCSRVNLFTYIDLILGDLIIQALDFSLYVTHCLGASIQKSLSSCKISRQVAGEDRADRSLVLGALPCEWSRIEEPKSQGKTISQKCPTRFGQVPGGKA